MFKKVLGIGLGLASAVLGVSTIVSKGKELYGELMSEASDAVEGAVEAVAEAVEEATENIAEDDIL